MKKKVIDYILDTYGVEADFPFATAPENAIFRNQRNRKWFAALLGGLPKRCLGLAGSDGLDVSQSLVGNGARYATVHHVVVAKGFPPLVHVGDAVTDKNYLLRVDGQHFECIITMIAEGKVCKDCGYRT